MPTGNAKFEAAANEAGCNFLIAAGGAATQFAAYSLLSGSLVTGAAGAAVAGIAAWAYASNCQYDTDAALPPISGSVGLIGCIEVQASCAGGYDLDQFTSDGTFKRVVTSNSPYISINGVEKVDANTARINVTHVTTGDSWITISGVADGDLFGFSGVPDGCCIKTQPTGPITPPPPYVYTDPDDGCQINVSFQGWGVDGSGTYSPVWQMDPILPPARAGGGIIGGCNFNPVIYYEPPSGPPSPPIPIPPSPAPGPDGEPWWVKAIRIAAPGIAAAVASELLEELTKVKYPAGNREIYAACNYKQDGTPETFSVNFPEESYQDRVLTSLNAIVDFQQQILLWKTPTCSGGGQSVTGDPVTVTWRSDEMSPASAARVRKIFTYFDQSGTPQLDHVLHWENFTFQAGAVIVSVNGVSLGKPQVWAATAEEGKRVINHAAAIAGVDMSNAEWVITSPRSTRYGVPGTMRVYKDDQNKIWVTKRDGPSGPVGLYG